MLTINVDKLKQNFANENSVDEEYSSLSVLKSRPDFSMDQLNNFQRVLLAKELSEVDDIGIPDLLNMLQDTAKYVPVFLSNESRSYGEVCRDIVRKKRGVLIGRRIL